MNSTLKIQIIIKKSQSENSNVFQINLSFYHNHHKEENRLFCPLTVVDHLQHFLLT